jgi:hypothetical protein
MPFRTRIVFNSVIQGQRIAIAKASFVGTKYQLKKYHKLTKIGSKLDRCLEKTKEHKDFCWNFGIVDQSDVPLFPRGYLGWQDPGHSNVNPFPWKDIKPNDRYLHWKGYGWSGYRPSRWGQRMDDEAEAIAALPDHLRPKLPKDRTGTYEYQVLQEQRRHQELNHPIQEK